MDWGVESRGVRERLQWKGNHGRGEPMAEKKAIKLKKRGGGGGRRE